MRLRRSARAVALVALLALPGCGDATASDVCGPVQAEPLHPDASQHVIPGAEISWDSEVSSWDSAAPTSGPHYSLPPATGAFLRQLEPAEQVTALEAGHVLIQYRPDLPAAAVDAVVALAADDVAVAPSADLDAAIMATAWQQRQRCDGQADAQLRAFVRNHAGRGTPHN